MYRRKGERKLESKRSAEKGRDSVSSSKTYEQLNKGRIRVEMSKIRMPFSDNYS